MQSAQQEPAASSCWRSEAVPPTKQVRAEPIHDVAAEPENAPEQPPLADTSSRSQPPKPRALVPIRWRQLYGRPGGAYRTASGTLYRTDEDGLLLVDETAIDDIAELRSLGWADKRPR